MPNKFKDLDINKIINWSSLSTQLGLSRKAIYPGKIPKVRHKELEDLFTKQIPEYWTKKAK